jgi:hypothetical protein
MFSACRIPQFRIFGQYSLNAVVLGRETSLAMASAACTNYKYQLKTIIFQRCVLICRSMCQLELKA